MRRPGQAGTRGGWGKLWSRVLTCSFVTFVPVGGGLGAGPHSPGHTGLPLPSRGSEGGSQVRERQDQVEPGGPQPGLWICLAPR